MKKLTLLLALFALVPFALAACGGDDDDEEPAPPPPPAEKPADGKGGAAKAVDVAADPGGALAYQQKSLTGSAGEVTFAFENPATLGHDFCVEDRGGKEVDCTDVISEDSQDLTLDLEAGEYTFFCSVPGHRDGGMEGDLTIK